jgi:hypothetical protein
MNKDSAPNAGNGILGLQISNIFWGRMPPDPHSNAPPSGKPPPPLINQSKLGF